MGSVPPDVPAFVAWKVRPLALPDSAGRWLPGRKGFPPSRSARDVDRRNIRRKVSNGVERPAEVRLEIALDRLRAVGEEVVAGDQRRARVQRPHAALRSPGVAGALQVPADLPDDVARRLDEPRDRDLRQQQAAAEPGDVREGTVGTVGEDLVVSRRGVERVPLRQAVRREREVVRLVLLGREQDRIRRVGHRRPGLVGAHEDDVVEARQPGRRVADTTRRRR